MAKIRILVAEDENLVGRDILNMLQGIGYEVVDVVSSGEDAVRVAESASPDLVLMDIVLRGEMDGIAAAERIWDNFAIPVIYLTAYADEKTLQRAKVTEPFGYILKPFDERELQTTIEMAFYKAKMDKKLREREEWLSTILKNIGDGVIATDDDNCVSFMNPLAEKLTGCTQSDALHRPLSDVFAVEDQGGTAGSALRENRLKTRAGEIVPIEQSLSTIPQGKKGTLGHVIVFRNITERVNAEAELKRSWDRLQKALTGTLQAMAMTIELRDPYTAGHQRRVGRLSSAIAQELGLPQDQIEGIRVAGEIHDIGKIYVPAEILSKPGKIVEIEYSIIKNHAQLGYDILKSIEFPWPVAEIVFQHHERLNGSGYPNGLAGENIMLEARIIGIADTVEAMSSHRPYRPAHGIDKALEEIRNNRGLLYDPRIVDVTLKLFLENKFSIE